MKLTFNREQLNKGIQSILGILNTKTGLPILDYALIEVKNNKITIFVSDEEILTQINIPCFIDGDKFDFVCDLKTVQSTASLLRSEEFILDVDDKLIIMSTPKTRKRFEIPIVYSADSFPLMGHSEWMSSITIKGSIFSAMIKRASLFISPTDLRPALTSIHLSSTKDVIRIQGTEAIGIADSAYSKGESDDDFPEFSNILFPKGITKIISNYEQSLGVKIFVDEEMKNAMLDDDGIKTQIRLTSSNHKYPPIDELFKNHNTDHFIKVNRESLLMGVRRIALYAGKANQIRINMEDSDIVISSSNDEFSKKAEETIDVEYKSELMNFVSGVNHNYLSTILNTMTGENVFITQPAYNTPFLLVDDSTDGYTTMWGIAAFDIKSKG